MEYNPCSLTAKVIAVTGASAGIGRATAIECSRLGAQVVLIARSADRLAETRALMAAGDHVIIATDLADETALAELVRELPPLDGLVNNAGVTDMLPLDYIDSARLTTLLAINERAPILLTAALARARKLKKNAAVVMVSSIDGTRVVNPGNAMYAASKGAVSAFMRGAALELARRKVRVNAVCPGAIKTGIFSAAITEEQLRENAKMYPLRRYGEPSEVAQAIAFLLSDMASFITGAELVVDGGFSIV